MESKPSSAVTPFTYVLLAANIAAFVLETQLGQARLAALLLWPFGPHFLWWQPLTSAFLHADPLHLATNMFGSWMFGRPVERAVGSLRLVELYGASLATSAATQLAVGSLLTDKIPTLGASGALFGVLAAFAALFPDRIIVLLFPPIPMKAKVFVLLYALLELVSGIGGFQPGIAHFAHLGGLFGGVLMIRFWRRRDMAQSLH